MTSQENERGVPNTLERRQTYELRSRTGGPALPAVEQQCLPWLVIYAMEHCGFSPKDIRRVVAKLHEVFDFYGLEEAQQHFENSPY